MAVIEQLVISKIIDEQSVEEAVKAGVVPHHFAGEFEDVYRWVLAYTRDHGGVPTERAFTLAHGDIEIVDTGGETFSGLFSELLASYRASTLTEAVSEAVKSLNKEDSDQAAQTLAEGLRKSSVEGTRLRDVNLVDNWTERYERYEERRAHPEKLLGIPTGFRGLDKITNGFRKQQFVVLAGEPKRGKSLFEMIMAQAAHDTARRVLFITKEMSNEEQESRYDALNAGVDYNSILSGNMNDSEMARIKEGMRLRRERQPFIMSEDASSLTTIGAIRAKAQEYMPDIIFIDGIYLLDDEEGATEDWKKLTNVSRGGKRMAQDLDITVVATTQVLASKVHNTKTRQITGDAIGYTSAFLQDADLLLGVELDPDVPNQSIIRVVESRASATGFVKVKWDWSTMNFSEGGFSDDGDEEDDDRDYY